MSAQVAADLRAAADVLAGDRWVQGATQTYDGEREVYCFCVIGAIGEVTKTTPSYDAYLDAVNALAKLVGPPVNWNDTPGRTAAEVIAALRAAADRVEAESC